MAFINFPSLSPIPSLLSNTRRLCQLSFSSSDTQTAHDELNVQGCMQVFYLCKGHICSTVFRSGNFNLIGVQIRGHPTLKYPVEPHSLQSPGNEVPHPSFEPKPRPQQKWGRKKCLKVLSKLSSQLCFTRWLSEWIGDVVALHGVHTT